MNNELRDQLDTIIGLSSVLTTACMCAERGETAAGIERVSLYVEEQLRDFQSKLEAQFVQKDEPTEAN